MPSLVDQSGDLKASRLVDSKKVMAAADALGALASVATSTAPITDSRLSPDASANGSPREQNGQATPKRDGTVSSEGSDGVEQPPAEASKENSAKDAISVSPSRKEVYHGKKSSPCRAPRSPYGYPPPPHPPHPPPPYSHG